VIAPTDTKFILEFGDFVSDQGHWTVKKLDTQLRRSSGGPPTPLVAKPLDEKPGSSATQMRSTVVPRVEVQLPPGRLELGQSFTIRVELHVNFPLYRRGRIRYLTEVDKSWTRSISFHVAPEEVVEEQRRRAIWARGPAIVTVRRWAAGAVALAVLPGLLMLVPPTRAVLLKRFVGTHEPARIRRGALVEVILLYLAGAAACFAVAVGCLLIYKFFQLHNGGDWARFI
jgi:hypothetical protein